MVTVGIVCMAVAGVILAQLQVDSGMGLLIGALALRGFAMGFCMMPSQAAALARVPRQYTSRASSITNTLQRVGSSIGIAVLVTVLSAQFAPAAQQVACLPSQAALVASGRSHSQLCNLVQSGTSDLAHSSGGAQALPPGPTSDFVHAYANSILAKAFDRTFAFIAILTVFGLIPAWFLRKPEPHSEADAPLIEVAA